MKANVIRRWDRKARESFTYREDGPKDRWRSSADQVLEGESWEGDCDDLASTVLDLLGREGCPLNHRYRLMIDTDGSGKADHMAGAVLSANMIFYVVGDVNGPMYRAHLGVDVLQHNRLDEVAAGGDPIWRSGAPWMKL